MEMDDYLPQKLSATPLKESYCLRLERRQSYEESQKSKNHKLRSVTVEVFFGFHVHWKQNMTANKFFS
jgi:hypothetical protein